MATATIAFPKDAPATLTIVSVVGQDDAPVTATLVPQGGGSWELTFTEPAPDGIYAYTLSGTWPDGSVAEVSGRMNGRRIEPLVYQPAAPATPAAPGPPDLLTGLVTSAAGPQSASGDSGSMSQHSLPDQIAADRYHKAAANNRGLGIRHVKLRPPGASGIHPRDGCF